MMSSLPEGVTFLKDTLREQNKQALARLATDKAWLERLRLQFAAWEAMSPDQKLGLRLDVYADNFKRLAEMTEDWDGHYGFEEACTFGCDILGCRCRYEWGVYQDLKKRFSKAETEDMSDQNRQALATYEKIVTPLNWPLRQQNGEREIEGGE